MEKYIDPRRYLRQFDASSLPHIFTDVLIIGSGAAGLRAAIEAAGFASVLVLTKDEAAESNTKLAMGGIAAALSPEDSIEEHISDTLKSGQGLSDEEVVRLVASRAPGHIEELIQWGAQFDRDDPVKPLRSNGDEKAGDSPLNLAREGGHSRARIVHAKGDATGIELARVLLTRARSHPHIQTFEHTFVIDLLTQDGTCVGALVHNEVMGFFLVRAKTTILASGGAGQIYRETTNPAGATGDGLAIAYRAGAKLRDMEFVQFHPTTLYIAGASRTLISEAVRGEGAVLRNNKGERFMLKFTRDAELAPRDLVSRAILTEMKATGDTSVYLDLTHLPEEKVAQRFPLLADLCATFDIDITRDLIPVRPSVHYFLGGVVVDEEGRTALQNLYAAGEVSSTGLHGANRLGSNSLLESLFFGVCAGAAAGKAAAARPKDRGPLSLKCSLPSVRRDSLDLGDVVNSLKSLMWRRVGIERDGPELAEAERRIDFWCSYVLDKEFDKREGWTLQNMLTVAKLTLVAARLRRESRGVHLRLDFPDRDDVRWKRHLVFQKGKEPQ